MKSWKYRLCMLMILAAMSFGSSIAVSAAVSFVPKQTDASVDSVTITWPEVSGAVQYKISWWKDGTSGDTAYSALCSTPSVKITGLKKNTVYSYQIAALNAKNKVIGETPNSYLAYPAPGKIKTVSVEFWGEKKGVTFQLGTHSYEKILYGIEWEIWNEAGTKRLYKGTFNSGSTFKVSKLARTAVYKLKVRGYSAYKDKWHDGPFYGEWHTKTIVPEPVLVKAVRQSGGKSVKLSWKKVTGATKYCIYASTKKDSGYKKVATVKSTKTSAVVKKVKNKAIKSGTTYYFCIRAYKNKTASTYGYCAEV